MLVPVKMKVEEVAPWRASRHRKVESKDEFEDDNSGVAQPPTKKKKGLPQRQPDFKSAKDRLIEDLAATQDEEKNAAQQKQRLLAELAAKAQTEKEAAEKKQKMLEKLAELERLERDEEERQRQMQEERKRAKVRAEEVAAKVRERQLAEQERQKRAAEAVAVLQLSEIEEEFDKIMLGDHAEEKDDSPDFEQPVEGDAPPMADSDAHPDFDDRPPDVETEWGPVARPSQTPMRPTQRQYGEWTPYRSTHDAEEDMPWSLHKHVSSSSASALSPARILVPKAPPIQIPPSVGPRVVRPIRAPPSLGPRVVRPIQAPRIEGPRVVRPRVPSHALLMDGRAEDDLGEVEPAQGPRVIAPRVVDAPAFRPNLVRPDAPIDLDEAYVQLQPDTGDPDVTCWRVVPTVATIRDSMDLVESNVVGSKNKGECIKGMREGDWLALTEEEGYIMIRRGIVNILEEIPHAADWKADAGAWGTAEGNVVVAGVKYTGFVKQFGIAAPFGFITSPEIVAAFGKDVFVTQRELENLTPGQKVTFRVEIHKGRPQAFDIERLDSKERGPGLKWKKTKLCDNWVATGACRVGDKCQYAHGEDDLGNDRPQFSSKKAKRLDRANRARERGDDCRWRHISVAPSCVEFEEIEDCSRGDDCEEP